MFFLGLHLRHGFQSAFQSLGINFPKYNFIIKLVGFLLYAIVPFGFSVLSIILYTRSLD